MDNREYFNSMAEKWDTIVYHDEAKIRRILEIVRINKGSRILDVGTGTGVMVPFLHELAGETGKIIAVDVAEKMIEVASGKHRFDNVEFIAADVLEMELPDNFFDCIMCYSMFPHFSDKEAAVARLSKNLKDGGKLAICHSQSREAINKLHESITESAGNDRLPDSSAIERYFSKAGLKTCAIADNDEMFVVVGCKI